MSKNPWSPGDQVLRADGPQGINPAANLIPYGPTLVAAEASWSREEQGVRQAGPQRTIFRRDLVPGAPPCPVSTREGGRGGSRRTRFRPGLIPTGPGLPATWSPGDQPHPGCGLFGWHMPAYKHAIPKRNTNNDNIIDAPTADCYASLEARHIERKPAGGCMARRARLRTHVAAPSFKFEIGHPQVLSG